MDKLREKYHKIKTLVDQGATEGERQAATLALQRMEEAHPELKELPYETNRYVSLEEATRHMSRTMEETMDEMVRQVFIGGILRMRIDYGTTRRVDSVWKQNSDGTWTQVR